MSIAKNTVYNLAGTLVPLATSVLTVPFYIKAIGVERYGVLALCWLILGFMGFLNLGMGPAVAQRLASMTQASHEERAEVFWTATWLNMSMGVLGGLLVFIFTGFYFAEMSHVSGNLSGEIRAAIPVLALIIPTIMVSGIFGGALQGRERFLAMNLINSISSVLMSLLPLGWALLVGPHLRGLIAAALVSKIVALVLSFWVCINAVALRRPRRPVPALVRQLVSFGGWVTVTSFIVPIVVSLDRFVIGAAAGAAAVSVYSIAMNLVTKVSILPVSLAAALFPRFAAADWAQARDLQADSAAALVSVLTPLTVILLAVLGPFLHVWIGAKLAEQALPLAEILVVGIWFNSIAQVPYAFLEARGRPDLIAKLHLVYILPYLGALYLGLIWLGVVGAALVWSLRSFFDPSLYFLAGSLRRVLPILLPPAAVTAVAVLVALLCSWNSALHWSGMTLVFLASLLLARHQAPFVLRSQIERRLPALFVKAQRAA